MSEAITIRPFEERDLKAYGALMNDSRIAQWVSHTEPMDEEKLQSYWNRICDPANPNQPYSRSVELDGEWVGMLHGSVPTNNRFATQFGYYLQPEHHGKGIMTQVIASIEQEQWAAGRKRLQTLVAPDNAASRRLMEKCGFELEGILRSFYMFQGRLIDVCMYAKVSQ